MIDSDPTTAGIRRVRDIIAAWLVRPPRSVTIPLTNWASIWEVSDGVISLATMTTGWSMPAMSGNCLPNRWAKARLATSLTSAARSCMYWLSTIAANMSAKPVITLSTAASAPVWFSSISVLICPIISGSDKMAMWASKTSNSSSPKRPLAFSLILLNSSMEA